MGELIGAVKRWKRCPKASLLTTDTLLKQNVKGWLGHSLQYGQGAEMSAHWSSLFWSLKKDVSEKIVSEKTGLLQTRGPSNVTFWSFDVFPSLEHPDEKKLRQPLNDFAPQNFGSWFYHFHCHLLLVHKMSFNFGHINCDLPKV